MRKKEEKTRSICFSCSEYTVGIGDDESWCRKCRMKLDENVSGPVPVPGCGGPYRGAPDTKEGGERNGESHKTPGGEP